MLYESRKWQQISTIYKLAVRNDNISHFGDEIGDVISHITEIDLQDNLIWLWEEVKASFRVVATYSNSSFIRLQD